MAATSTATNPILVKECAHCGIAFNKGKNTSLRRWMDSRFCSRRCAGLGKPKITRHGMSHQPEHNAWTGMKQRCHNPRNKGYVNYGGRGIAVCDRWRDSFEAFYEDMGSRPSPAHSLERIDNDGPYAPGNVRWASDVEQANNKRDSRRVMHEGKSVTLADAERLSGISQKVLSYRLNAGWANHRLFEPVDTSKRNRSGE